MTTTVHADIRTGKVYRVPFATRAEARRYVRGVHRPYRGVLVSGSLVECYEAGRLVSREEK